MAGKLKKQDASHELTFEVFDLDLDDDDRQRLADDPRGFLTKLLQEEGQTVNGLLMESDEKFQKPDGSASVTGGPSLPPSVWHCTAPPEKRSKWITIVPGVADDGGNA